MPVPADFDPLTLPLNANPNDLATVFVGVGIPAALAATGSVQGDAALLVGRTTTVTAADATKGVILPAYGQVTTRGAWVVYNNAAAVLKLWPPTGASIGTTGANLNVTLAAGQCSVFVPVSSTLILRIS